jgi:chromosome partitioning protein
MNVIAIANTKGGVGKTTLTAALAVRAARDSPRVALVDLDPQKSLVEWWNRRGKSENPAIFDGGNSTAQEAVEALRRHGWDWVFLDGPPAFLTTIEETLQVATLAVVPIKPSMIDMLAARDALVLAYKHKTPVLAVLNDCHKDKLTAAARAAMEAERIPVAATEIMHRVSHIASMTVGKTGPEVNNGRDKAAVEEINALWLEIKATVAKINRATAAGAA